MAEILKIRQREILKHLMTSGVPMDINFFKEKFQKSERTIRYDLNEIKEVCKKHDIEIKYQTKYGFFIPASQKVRCSKLLISDKYQTESSFSLGSDEERYKMLFIFLIAQKKMLTADQIAEKLYISRSTLVRMLTKFEQYFDGSFRVVAKKNKGYVLMGYESALRKAATEIITGRLRYGHTPQEWRNQLPKIFKDLISEQQILKLSETIKKVNAKYNIWISDSEFQYLLAYCIVMEIRSAQTDREHISSRVNSYADRGYGYELISLLYDNSVRAIDHEIEYLIPILNECKISVNIQKYDEMRLVEALMSLESLLNESEVMRDKEFDIGIIYKELFDHLKNFLYLYNRRQEPKEENHTVIRELKEHYYEFYQLAVDAARVLEKHLQVKFSDTEVCYIAVYLYKNCRVQEKPRKKVLVVCATGKGLSHLLTIRLENVFPMIQVIGQMSPYHFADTKHSRGADFIISTVPLEQNKIPVVQISRILSSDDIIRIQSYLDYGAEMAIIPPIDPFDLRNASKEFTRKDMVHTANILSKLILTLLEYTSKIPDSYKISQDALLGLIIHMCMAVPRWYEGREVERSGEAYEEEYERIQNEHQEVFSIMERFFELIEKYLMVSISLEEKNAIYLYLLKEEK